jgi:hypothetical protein
MLLWSEGRFDLQWRTGQVALQVLDLCGEKARMQQPRVLCALYCCTALWRRPHRQVCTSLIGAFDIALSLFDMEWSVVRQTGNVVHRFSLFRACSC